jgi:hypothetical protein
MSSSVEEPAVCVGMSLAGIKEVLLASHSRRCIIEGKQKEYWMQLCEQAANEQDSARLMELVREITRLLEEKARRLNLRAASQKG